MTRSLAARLMLALGLLQSLVVVGGMVLWMVTGPYVTWQDVAARSLTRLVVNAATRGEPRDLAALAAYAARRPGLEYAALVQGQVLPGATPELAVALARLGPLLPREGALRLTDPALGDVRFIEQGGVVVASAGNRFMADDLPTYARDYLLQLIPLFGPALLAGLVALPLVIRRVLRPVRVAARQASAIDHLTLDRRLESSAAPAELQPFIASINALLDRVEDGVRRQRLFTANAAHELRTPVAVLQARLDALPDGPDLAGLRRDLRRITLLLDQLLAVARLGQRGVALDEVVDLATLARRVAADLAPLAIRDGRHVAVELSGPPPLIAGNAAAVESALANLLANALRVEPPGGTVQIQVGPGAVIAVRDHGPGVAVPDRAMLFEPFWRSGGSGTGLGLAIVQEVAVAHGGQARFEPGEGGGAVFLLDFSGARAIRQLPARQS